MAFWANMPTHSTEMASQFVFHAIENQNWLWCIDRYLQSNGVNLF